MKICGACMQELSDDEFSAEQQLRRQSTRRCMKCVAAGNELVLMKRGRVRAKEDECPICNLPLPIADNVSMLTSCCMKRVCNGCILSSRKCGIDKCPFCRSDFVDEVDSNGDSQVLVRVKKRVASGDPMAMFFLGDQYRCGGCGLKKDARKAAELLRQSAALGIHSAHYILADMYNKEDEGMGVDRARSLQHMEEAAMGGNPSARFSLGVNALIDGHSDIALQHFLISAKLGDEDSLDAVRRLLQDGIATKTDYAGALQGYEAAVEEMSSPSREEAKRGI